MSPCIVNSIPSPIATSNCPLIPFLIIPSTKISFGPISNSVFPISVIDIILTFHIKKVMQKELKRFQLLKLNVVGRITTDSQLESFLNN